MVFYFKMKSRLHKDSPVYAAFVLGEEWFWRQSTLKVCIILTLISNKLT